MALAASRAAAAPVARVAPAWSCQERDGGLGDDELASEDLLGGRGDDAIEDLLGIGERDRDLGDDPDARDGDDDVDDGCRRAEEGAFDYLDLDLDLTDRSTAQLTDRKGAERRATVGDAIDAATLAALADIVADDELDAVGTLVGAGLDSDDGTAVYEPLLHDGDVAFDSFEAGAFDDPLVREAVETGSAFASSAFADPSELADLELRHQRPSRWGRLDLTIAWRRAWTPQPVTISLAPLPHGPIAQTYDTADHLLVLATWSR